MVGNSFCAFKLFSWAMCTITSAQTGMEPNIDIQGTFGDVPLSEGPKIDMALLLQNMNGSLHRKQFRQTH